MTAAPIRRRAIRPLSAPAAILAVGLAIVSLGLAVLAGWPAGAATPAAQKTSAKAPAVPQPAVETVEPEALAALHRMSAYLQGLSAFALTSQTSLDLVLRDGQKVEVDGVSHYKVRRPGGFVIDVDSNMKTRRFVYDGKSFTLYAPKLGYYATIPAPATNRETLELLWTKYQVALPLEDLFRWSDPGGARDARLRSGFRAGTVSLDGVETDQYVFREPGFDWQIWIQAGDKPIPRKLVIIDRTDAARPAYTARLAWDMSPTLAAADFAFQPPKDARPIKLEAMAKEGGK